MNGRHAKRDYRPKHRKGDRIIHINTRAGGWIDPAEVVRAIQRYDERRNGPTGRAA